MSMKVNNQTPNTNQAGVAKTANVEHKDRLNTPLNTFKGPQKQIDEMVNFDLERVSAHGRELSAKAADRRKRSDIASEFSQEDFSWDKVDGKMISSLSKEKPKVEGDQFNFETKTLAFTEKSEDPKKKEKASSEAKEQLVAHQESLDSTHPKTATSVKA